MSDKVAWPKVPVLRTEGAGPRQVPWLNPDTMKFEWRDPDLLSVRYFAAHDEPGDQTGMIQAAIDFAEANLDKYRRVYLPAGRYEVSELASQYVSLVGEQSARPVAGTFDATTDLGTVLLHKAGSTNPMITLTGGIFEGYGWDLVEKMVLIGRQNQNLAVPKRSIVSAASRTQFTVAVGDLPAQPSNSTSFPGYGVCVFYDADGGRLGTGIVQSVNTGTGQVTLFTGTDNYTGITGSGGLLTNTEKVAFAPKATYTIDGVAQTDVSDSTMLSPPAILVMGRTKSLRDLYVYGFHAGIVLGDSVTQINRVWTNNCGMAGYAHRNLGSGADVYGTQWYFQGNSARTDVDQPASSVGVIDPYGAMSLCGLWGVPSISYVSDITTNNGYHGVIDRGGGSNFRTDFLLLDIPFKEPWLTWNGNWSGGLADPTVHVGTLIARANRAAITKPTSMTFPSGHLSVIAIKGTNHRKLAIGTISATRDPGGDPADDFEYLTNIADTATNGYHDIFIDHLADVTAVSHAPVLWTGQYPYKMSAPFGHANSPYPVQIASKRIIGGSDSPSLTGISDAVDKVLRLGVFNYQLTGVPFVGLALLAQSAANVLVLGGGDSGAEAATTINLVTASAKGTGAGTTRLTIGPTGAVAIGPAAVGAAACAALDVQSTTTGFLPPRMTSTQRDAIANQTDGLVIYNTTTSKLQIRAGGAWVDLH